MPSITPTPPAGQDIKKQSEMGEQSRRPPVPTTGSPTPTPTPTSTSSAGSPDPVNNINWTEVTRDVWNALKAAGHWVKEQGGKLWALLNADGTPVLPDVWKCIDSYNDSMGYYKLSLAISDDMRFQTLLDSKGNKFKEEYYRNGDAIRYDKKSNSLLKKGKWGCGKDGKSYYIKWEDGVNEVRGEAGETIEDILPQDGGSGMGTGFEPAPTFSEVCTSVKACPTVLRVTKENKAFKLCMKCDEIEKLQNTPVFKQIYFRHLKNNNKEQKVDKVFGPIMEGAVKEYQEMYGIKKTGMIGTLTYKSMTGDKEPEPTVTPTPQPQTQTTNQQTTGGSTEEVKSKIGPKARGGMDFL